MRFLSLGPAGAFLLGAAVLTGCASQPPAPAEPPAPASAVVQAPPPAPTPAPAPVAPAPLKLPADGDLGGVVATGSSLAAAAVTDVLAEMLRVARDYSWESLPFTHPSGAVGRDAEKSLKRLGSN